MDFFEKDDKYVFIVEIRVVCGEFLAFQFPLFCFFSKQIRLHWVHYFFGTHYLFVLVKAGREYLMNIV